MMMMKKVFAVVLLFIVFTASSAADDDAPTPPGAPKFPGFPFRHRQFPWGPGHAFPPLPAGHAKLPSPDPKFQKCFQDFHVDQGCVQQIMTSFTSHKVNLDAKCCQSVQQIVDDCISAIFGHFGNPFFGPLLKKVCSSGSPSPPSA
ncbi:uncharacterized protein LOC8267015 [Ricinus communis]|uniref:uncharacterized protein LOC8267015 n=1 Tax=Ricinus communis TaxID=3988 RepID=UPI00201AD0FC|nr:uncharacterized protein LOC8267015 [Ricinus communis]